jgi:hypothetical protein
MPDVYLAHSKLERIYAWVAQITIAIRSAQSAEFLIGDVIGGL